MPMPPQVVVVPHSGHEVHSYSPNYSALFRDDTYIDAALDLVAEHYPKHETLKVLSAGCSFGPEIDTVLAVRHKAHPDTSTAVTGIDSDSTVLASAEKGMYRVASLDRTERLYRTEGLDFGDTMAGYTIAISTPRVTGKDERTVVDTRELRSPRTTDITLRQADLRTTPSGLSEPAHLILCHNLLYHHPDPAASMILGNLAIDLAPGGVLSIGNTLVHQRAWLAQVSVELATAGIKRVYAERVPSRVVMFRRERET